MTYKARREAAEPAEAGGNRSSGRGSKGNAGRLSLESVSVGFGWVRSSVLYYVGSAGSMCGPPPP